MARDARITFVGVPDLGFRFPAPPGWRRFSFRINEAEPGEVRLDGKAHSVRRL